MNIPHRMSQNRGIWDVFVNGPRRDEPNFFSVVLPFRYHSPINLPVNGTSYSSAGRDHLAYIFGYLTNLQANSQ